MPAYTGAFSALLAPGLRKVWHDEYKDWPEEHSQIATMLTSKRAYEEEHVMAGLGRMERKPEGTALTYDDPINGSTVRFTHISFALGFRVSREMYEDDQYGIMKKMSKQLARSARQTAEVEFGGLWDDAFAGANYTGADGQPLCTTAHTLLVGGTFANEPTVAIDLGISSLRAMLENREALVDDRGLPVQHPATQLLIGPSNQWMAKELIGSAQKPYTSDNEINAFKGLDLSYMVYHYSTDPDAWWLLAPKAYHDIKFFWRTKPDFDNGDDYDTKDAKFSVFARFSLGFTDWRGVDGSPGA